VPRSTVDLKAAIEALPIQLVRHGYWMCLPAGSPSQRALWLLEDLGVAELDGNTWRLVD